jgi:hypothetical protein
MTRSAKRTFAPMGYPSREKWRRRESNPRKVPSDALAREQRLAAGDVGGRPSDSCPWRTTASALTSGHGFDPVGRGRDRR